MDENNFNEQIKLAMDIVQKLFGNKILGIYLYGSAVLGGLQKNSDIDLLIIINSDMSKEYRRILTESLLKISGEIGNEKLRSLEVTIINKNDDASHYQYMYGEWLREDIEAGTIPKANQDPDIIILLWQARSHGLTLYGDDAINVIPNISIEDVKVSIRSSLDNLLSGVKGDERNTLLTLSRMLYTLKTGNITSKDDAVRWLIPQIPLNLSPLLELAVNGYLGLVKDDWSGYEVELSKLIDYIVDMM